MNKFLFEVANDLLKSELNFSKHICLVPNKRMALFLKNNLIDLNLTSDFLPEFITTKDLIENSTSCQVADQLELLIILFHVYQKEVNPEIDFNDFIGWGKQVLGDFNEIDLYQVDAKQLFSFVSEVRAIEVWNVDGSPITDFQKKYLVFWSSLESLFTAFKKELILQNKNYSGMAYDLLNKNFSLVENEYAGCSFSVIGFNALSNAEMKMFDQLTKSFSCKFYWDSDQFYLQDNNQEAGIFLRSLVKRYPSWENLLNSRDQEKRINLVPAAQNVSQAKLLIQCLKEIPKNELTDTAVLLADESLLIPLINALPEHGIPANITMGYSIRLTQVFSLLEIVLELKNRQVNDKRGFIYHKDLLRLMDHELFKKSFNNSKLKSLKNDLIKKNRIYVDPLLVKSFIHQSEVENIFKIIFEDNWKIDFNSNLLSQLLKEFKSSLKLEEASWDSEQFYLIIEKLRLIDQYTEKYAFLNDLSIYKRIFRQIVSQAQLDFIGEPLSGVQIMGLLESRGLDFKNVLICSVNEGILPQGNKSQSFMPFDIKTNFGMPTWKDRDAIYAYYFYRSIQRAENIYLFYSDQADDFNSGEMSRFISQMQYEWKSSHQKSELKEIIYSNKVNSFPSESISIKNNTGTIERLKEWGEKGISPSALNTYLNCSLDFYYQYILRQGELQEVEESVSASTYGSIIHAVLEDLFLPFVLKEITEEDIDKMKVIMPAVLDKHYKEEFEENDIQTGKNYLSTKVAKSSLERFLSIQKKEVVAREGKDKLKLIALEENYQADLLLDNGLQVSIKGNADRVDNLDGVRLLDYKSGKVIQKDLEVKKIEELESKPKALQLMIYAWLYYKKEGVVPDVVANISFRNLQEWLIPVTIGGVNRLNESILKEFEDYLKSIVSRIYQEDNEFEHKKALYCQFCE